MSEHETTPLVNRAGGSRRRGVAPQHMDPFSSSVQENDKRDRRSLWDRTKATWKTFFAFRGGMEPPDEERYYEDDYNDFSWKCTFGTHEGDGIWMNRGDQPGIIMSILVWVLIIYSSVTIALLAQNNNLPYPLAMVHATLCAGALASHAKTMFSDPGSVPQSAVPIENLPNETHPMCSHCQTYKPPYSHHCRICNRCISRMDHHCPWMNNCIGAGNIKFFVLFLVYIWVGSAFSLLIFAWNYFLCNDDACTFSAVLIQLVRVMTLICIGALLFTSSMLMSIVYAVLTGIGTIDRLKRKISKSPTLSDEEPIDLEDIFGIQGYYTWPVPIDPIFEDFDRVMGYSTTQRLLRERKNRKNSGVTPATASRRSAMGRTSDQYSV